MNKLSGIIKKTTSSGNIVLAEVDVENTTMAAIMINTPEFEFMLQEGKEVQLAFKESEVSIGKDLQGEISIRNKLDGKITKIERGIVFSKVTFDFKGYSIVSLITTDSANRLKLRKGNTITGLIKANEVMIFANNL